MRAVLLALLLTSCSTMPQAEPPVKTGAPVLPPPGCEQLRAAGGSC